MPPSTLLPLYSQASPNMMPPTTCLPLYSETPPTLPPMHIPALSSPLTNAGVEEMDIFADEFRCFEGNAMSDCLVAAEPEARAMSFNKKELSMTVDDKDERSDDVVLDKDILLAEMVRKFIDVFN